MSEPCTEKPRLVGMERDIAYLVKGQDKTNEKVDKIFDLLDGPNGAIATLAVAKKDASRASKRQWTFVGGAFLAGISAWIKELFI